MTTQAKKTQPLNTYLKILQELAASFRASAPQVIRRLWQTQRHWLWVLIPLAAVAIRPLRWAWGSWFAWDSALSFQALVPLAVAWLIWTRRHEIEPEYRELAFMYPADSPKRRGHLWPVVVGCILVVASAVMVLTPLAIASLILIVVGCIYYIYGPFILRRLWQPLLLLLLMIPIPGTPLLILTQTLQVGSALVAGQVLQNVYPHVQIQGVFITMPNYQLEVTGPCSGTSIVFPVVAMTIVLAMYRKMRIGISLVLLAIAVAISVLLNILRILVMGLIGGANPQMAAGLHDSNSLIFTALAFYLTFLAAGMLMTRRRRVSAFEADLAASQQLSQESKTQ